MQNCEDSTFITSDLGDSQHQRMLGYYSYTYTGFVPIKISITSTSSLSCTHALLRLVANLSTAPFSIILLVAR